MISLKIIYNDGEKESLVFNQPVITIGRSSDNDVSLITAQGVSRHHAKLFREGENLVIEDLNSTNGTYVNSQKVTKTNVAGKDVIEIGSVCIKAVISNLAESSFSNPQVVDPAEELDPNDCLKKYLPEAFDKIHERTVQKVYVRTNCRVKFTEQGQEVELGMVYPEENLNKIANIFCNKSSATRVKISNGIVATIITPPLLNDGVSISFERITSEELGLEDYIREGAFCKDAEKIVSEAHLRGKNIIFAGADRKVIQGLVLALVEEKDSRVCFLDRFAKLLAPKNGLSFSAQNHSDLIEAASFSNSIGLNRFFIDDLEYYNKNDLNAFASMFSKGGVGYLNAANIKKLHNKVAELSGYGSDFWCHVLVWFEQKDDLTHVKSIFRAATTDAGLELVEIFSK